MKIKGLFVIVNNVRSAQNVGSIFRTADAVGVDKIFLCGYTPTPKVVKHETWSTNHKTRFKFQDSGDKIHKTALGAEESVPWEHYSQTWRLLEELKKRKINIVALEQTGESIDLFKFKPKFPLALILGNEVNGLSPKILKYADKKIAIQMYGKKESLNVSVAFGVAVYQLLQKKVR